jgi:pyruvate kinase
MLTHFLNGGLTQLEVVQVAGPEVTCRVVVGGELRSHKGLNTLGAFLTAQ